MISKSSHLSFRNNPADHEVLLGLIAIAITTRTKKDFSYLFSCVHGLFFFRFYLSANGGRLFGLDPLYKGRFFLYFVVLKLTWKKEKIPVCFFMCLSDQEEEDEWKKFMPGNWLRRRYRW